MKNLNLTGLYLALIKSCDVTNFRVSCLRKFNSDEPSDAFMIFDTKGDEEIDLKKVGVDLADNISGDIKTTNIEIRHNRLYVYVEFLSSDMNDNYAYPTN